MAAIVRGAIIVFGLFMMLGGLGLITTGPAFGLGGGLELVVIGGFLVVVVAIERQRYRSDAAERTNAATGPGGGEPAGAPHDPRFRPSTERFVDPTTGVQMRVLVDPRTGERRYVAEG
jgi:hypothetical protein